MSEEDVTNADRSNTAGQQRRTPTGKPFVKGDKRINRKGRPRTFDALRAEAVRIAHEVIKSPDGKIEASRIHAIMLDWATSKDPRKQEMFVAYAFGHVPTREEIKADVSVTANELGGALGKLETILKRAARATAESAASAGADAGDSRGVVAQPERD